MSRRDVWEVYLKTLAVSLGVYVANLAVERQLTTAIHAVALRWAAAFALVQTLAVLSFSLSLLAFRIYARWRESIYDQLRPAIRDRVLVLSFEGDSWSTEVPHRGPGRAVLEENIAHILSTLKASGRDRVARFAMDHGLAAEWVRGLSSRRRNERKRAASLLGLISRVAGNTALLAALNDDDPAVRAEASRALLVLGDPDSVDSVFRSVLRESLLTRALLADDLKRHAVVLLANTVPSVLEKATTEEAARCFEILIAWRRAMPSFDIHAWLSSDSDRVLQPLVLALLPYVFIDDSVEEYVAGALESSELDVQCAAAEAAGSLRFERLIPTLADALGGDKRLAVAAAKAIAQMGEAGERSLEKLVIGPDRNTAALAMEALEHITVRSL